MKQNTSSYVCHKNIKALNNTFPWRTAKKTKIHEAWRGQRNNEKSPRGPEIFWVQKSSFMFQAQLSHEDQAGKKRWYRLGKTFREMLRLSWARRAKGEGL